MEIKNTIRSEYLGRTYEQMSWKNESDKFFGAQEAIRSWEILRYSGLLPAPELPLLFVSPTANSATHELALWRHESRSRTGSTVFLAGDLLDPADLEIQGINNKKNGFHFVRMDAEHMPVRKNSADVIWDRKGWLWYQAAWKAGQLRLLESFMHYHAILRPGGILVTDSIPGEKKLTKFGKKMNKRMKLLTKHAGKITPSQVFQPINGQFEESTIAKISKNYPHIFDLITDDFEVIDIGEGIHSMRVFRKI